MPESELTILLVGIFLTFVVDRVYSHYSIWQKGKSIQRALREELERCRTFLTGKGNLCPVELWEASKASGLLELLTAQKISLLSATYESIKNHNYESIRVRDVSILLNSGIAPKADSLWDQLSKSLANSENELGSQIERTTRVLSN